MKKILLSLMVLGFIGMVSCKKDNTVQPTKSNNSTLTNGGDKRDVGMGD